MNYITIDKTTGKISRTNRALVLVQKVGAFFSRLGDVLRRLLKVMRRLPIGGCLIIAGITAGLMVFTGASLLSAFATAMIVSMLLDVLLLGALMFIPRRAV